MESGQVLTREIRSRALIMAIDSLSALMSAWCVGKGTIVSQVSVSSSDVPYSRSILFNSIGTYGWNAIYTGDGRNSGSASACQLLTVRSEAPNRTAPQTVLGLTLTLFFGALASALVAVAAIVESVRRNRKKPLVQNRPRPSRPQVLVVGGNHTVSFSTKPHLSTQECLSS